jgi:tRNA(Ile)-lysidine synthetase-like protein
MGMSGSKKLHDIFADAKVPRNERHRIPVVECRGEIVWLPGYRVARGWEVEGARAANLRISLKSA